MSGGRACTCEPIKPTNRWFVTTRNANYSAFNGYQHTTSPYSAVKCMECGSHWRTKADYVKDLPDAPADWYR